MSTLVLGTQGMFLDVTEPEDDDEDILDEAETIKFYFETLLKKNPLIVKEVSKVKLDLSNYFLSFIFLSVLFGTGSCYTASVDLPLPPGYKHMSCLVLVVGFKKPRILFLWAFYTQNQPSAGLVDCPQQQTGFQGRQT